MGTKRREKSGGVFWNFPSANALGCRCTNRWSLPRMAGLKSAISLYSRPDKYASLLVNCVTEVQKFSWDKAARKYRQVYDVATNRGM